QRPGVGAGKANQARGPATPVATALVTDERLVLSARGALGAAGAGWLAPSRRIRPAPGGGSGRAVAARWGVALARGCRGAQAEPGADDRAEPDRGDRGG